jgi:hypothetical protein
LCRCRGSATIVQVRIRRCKGEEVVQSRSCRGASAEVQRCRVQSAEVQRGAGAEVQRCRGAEVQRCRGAERCRCRGAEVQTYRFGGFVVVSRC